MIIADPSEGIPDEVIKFIIIRFAQNETLSLSLNINKVSKFHNALSFSTLAKLSLSSGVLVTQVPKGLKRPKCDTGV